MNLIKNILSRTFLIVALIFTNQQLLAQSEAHLYFDGVNDFLETQDPLLNTVSSDFTFEAIIKGNSEEQGENPTILSNRWSPIKGNSFFFQENGDAPRELCFSHGNDLYYIPDNGPFDGDFLDGFCHHIAIVKKDGDIFFYADGNLYGVIINPYYYCDVLDSPADIWIGTDHHYDRPFKGVIGQVRIWNDARTSEEVILNMHASLEGTESDLFGYWELDEGSGQIVFEKTSLEWSGYLGESTGTDGFDPDWFEGDYCINDGDYGDGEDDEVEDEQEDDSTASVENSTIAEIALYPNPVNDNELTIDFGSDLKPVTITIISISGKEVLQRQVTQTAAKVKLDVSELTKGIYFVKIEAVNQTITKKVIVN
ncbi:MAG: T9SS type A sorting domain-containing protein [Crocinitomix sp.]|nr:T9SS type A sorting domain-containing protein [Crocinitomix sp.]